MARKKAHSVGESSPKRLENAIPHEIREGNRDTVRVLVQRAQNNGLLTDAIVAHAMRTACGKDDAETLRFLLELATPEQIEGTHTKTKKTLLMNARSKEIAQLLIDKGANVNAVDANGVSALMHAASRDIAQTLVRQGADPETDHSQVRTALMHMLMQDRPSTAEVRRDIAHLLILEKANLDACDNQGRTILMTAVWRNHVSVVRELIDRVDIDATDLRGRNVLHHLCEDRDRAGRMMTAVGDDDHAMVDLLLSSKVQTNAQDDFEGKTPLHRAVEVNNLHIVNALLGKAQIQVDLADFRSKTPLHIAATNAHYEITKQLIRKNADVAAQSDGGWTPLHNAAASRDNSSTEIVRTLLAHEASATAKLRTGKTPLHLACEVGNVSVVKVLLEQPDVNIRARDNQNNTPLIAAAALGHAHIVKHLTPLSRAKAWSEEAINASKGFLATTVDFTPEPKNTYHQQPKSVGRGEQRKYGNRRERRRMYDLLYEDYPLSPNAPVAATPASASSNSRFRWIHCPSNNIAWCQDLLLKRFTEQEDPNAENFKAVEKSFNYQHRGLQLHAHYMRPTVSIIPQAHQTEGDLTDSDSSAVDVSESVEGTPSPPASRRRSQTRSTSRKKARPRKRHQSSETTAHGDEGGRTSQAESNGNEPLSRLSHTATSNMFLFAPYVHYETNHSRKQMQQAISDARSRKAAVPTSHTVFKAEYTSRKGLKYERNREDADENLIRAHVDAVSCTMNARRTLDQYYYRTIDTTKYRDHDQVVHRYQKKHLQLVGDSDKIRMLMVDQLWMWIVGDVIITAFPERWKQPRLDDHNVLETIISDINLPGRAISSIYELALIIATRCFGVFDRRNVSEGEMKVFDMFESSVGDAMDRETELFRVFNDASEDASHWLKVLTSPGKADYMFEQRIRAPKLEKDQEQHAGSHGKQEQKSTGPKLTLVRTLLDIGEETRLMREIKDIRDELNMLRMIFKEQEKLLSGLRKTLLEMIRRDSNGSKTLTRSIEKIYADELREIVNPLRDIDRMDKQAERTYNSVRDLLDLKSSYAISMQAADTSRQGRTLMVFTVVTVVFLPRSFLTAFFALDIRDVPHGPDGGQELPLSFVSKYIFGIGFVVALLCVLLALAWERIGLSIRHGRREIYHVWHKTKRRGGRHGAGENAATADPERVKTWHSDSTV